MKGYRTKKIALPGGKVIEIVYFSEPEGEDVAVEASVTGGRTTPTRSTLVGIDDLARELHVCPQCEGDLVYPVSWEERSGDSWRSSAAAPTASGGTSASSPRTRSSSSTTSSTRAPRTCWSALRNFARANMEADVERLIEAIHLDLIEPMDF